VDEDVGETVQRHPRADLLERIKQGSARAAGVVTAQQGDESLFGVRRAHIGQCQGRRIPDSRRPGALQYCPELALAQPARRLLTLHLAQLLDQQVGILNLNELASLQRVDAGLDRHAQRLQLQPIVFPAP
jgi:hypothetical protein